MEQAASYGMDQFVSAGRHINKFNQIFQGPDLVIYRLPSSVDFNQ